MSSRPSLAARPTRDVVDVVADMLGEDQKVATNPPETVKKTNLKTSKTIQPQAVNTATVLREKTSFAIRPTVKRHLTLLKLDLREAGHRVTEAEIVEALIAQADATSLARAFEGDGKRASRRRSAE